MCNVLEVADKADVIVNGYAFTRNGKNVKVLNLNHVGRAAVRQLLILGGTRYWAYANPQVGYGALCVKDSLPV